MKMLGDSLESTHSDYAKKNEGFFLQGEFNVCIP